MTHLYLLFKDAMKKTIRDTVEGIAEWPEAGTSRAERPGQLATLDSEIAKVEAELSELKTAARQAGVRVEG